MSIDYRGPVFVHGNVGALESYTGIGPLTKRAAFLYRKAKIEKSPEELTPRGLAASVKKKDLVAMQVWDEFTSQLATGLVNAVWLLNPDRIVIGGGIAKAGKLIFDPLWKKMKAQLAPSFTKNLKVVPAHFGNDAGIIGSAAVAVEATRA